MKLRLSFQGLILGGCLLVVLCTLVFVGVILHKSLHDQMIKQTEDSLRQVLLLAEQVISDRWPGVNSFREIDELADHVGQRVGLRVTLIDQNGLVLGDSEVPFADLETLDNHGGRPEVKQVKSGKSGSSVRFSSTLGLDLLYVATMVNQPDLPRLVVRLAMPLATVEETLAQIRSLIIGAIFLGALLSTGVAYLVARGISRPVRALTATASSIASGDLSRRFRRYPPHEIGKLGRAFDAMADSLQEKIEAITEARDRLHTILASMVEGVLVTDHDGRIIMANEALMVMLELKEDPAGHMPSEIFRNADLVEAMREARQSGVLVQREIRTLHPKERHLDLTVARFSGEGVPGGCVAVLHDITERKRVEQIRRDFVANVSHELRTPLTAIRGSVETLLGGALDSPKDALRFTEMIQRQAARLQTLAQDLLELAKIESGQATFQGDEVSVPDLAENTTSAVSEIAKQRQVDLQVDLSEAPPAFKADRHQVEQALLNLLDNAVKYTDAGGKVTLKISKAEDDLIIAVSDTGVGIAPQHLPRIFERFYRVDKDRSRELGGSGLGLAIVKHVAQAHGGRVDVESRPGRGSTFQFIIPA
ncbi:MAG: ATP-binding protein [Desulfarculaceae bacterium]|jgi:two-component system phosphate regulon sensor histidine kinase PhoR